HLVVPASDVVSTYVAAILDLPANNPAFSTFPAPGTLGAAVAGGGDLAPSAAPTILPGLHIIAPVSGIIVPSGGSIAVTVAADAGVVPSRVALLGPGNVLVDATPPFTFTYNVPVEAIGDIALAALGVDDTGNSFLSPAVHVTAKPEA